ncbi:low affinity iron permease family protein (plasmid) [Pseudochrobactrum algeriensis]|uniref:low affinity iron permease family protein n=1 Tax=Pseudochrobactrum algeriensis TaxID=2834768 RepID=UPI000E2795AA|nr:low affinity iron permease family protein [Pseudochrobactrum algeriensis]QVQ35488.1 low affinity iron permease family protein [Pseudochrobactrum algeriensis]QVQ42104.1 low affinity iron permease family protein [Pseudochrobactrum algeriensis]QVQ42362.1 low affinity iron permease family protein [Pseudochrobactrum algeriensis]
MGKYFSDLSEEISKITGHYGSFLIAITFIIIWSLSGPFFNYSDTWQLIVNTTTTIITFLMVFLIQNSQNRDSCALHTKVDELIDALKNADERVIGIEHLPLEELKKLRDKIEHHAALKSQSEKN